MKLKTHKATAKKIKQTGSKRTLKIMTKTAGQDHFNARESGNVTRHKRTGKPIAKAFLRTTKRQIPYN